MYPCANLWPDIERKEQKCCYRRLSLWHRIREWKRESSSFLHVFEVRTTTSEFQLRDRHTSCVWALKNLINNQEAIQRELIYSLLLIGLRKGRVLETVNKTRKTSASSKNYSSLRISYVTSESKYSRSVESKSDNLNLNQIHVTIGVRHFAFKKHWKTEKPILWPMEGGRSNNGELLGHANWMHHNYPNE